MVLVFKNKVDCCLFRLCFSTKLYNAGHQTNTISVKYMTLLGLAKRYQGF